MKNKKSLLGLGLFALILVLGVGYAVISDVELTFGGSAKGIDEAELKVDIVSVNDTKSGSATVTHTLGAGHVKADTFTITDMTLNETVTMVYTIGNRETDIDATLEEAVTLSNNNTEYFEASYKIDNASVKAEGTTTVTVTVKMIKTPVVDEKNIANISFKLNAKPVNNTTN